MQYKPNLFGFIAEMQLILCKDNANREENEMNSIHFLSRDAVYLMQRYNKKFKVRKNNT